MADDDEKWLCTDSQRGDRREVKNRYTYEKERKKQMENRVNGGYL